MFCAELGKYQSFVSETFLFFDVIFYVYLNRRVFVMQLMKLKCYSLVLSKQKI